jgi:uncharacterized protein (TIGR01777 family)
MNILIAGASGFIGKQLVNHLAPEHKITVIGRNIKKLRQLFTTDINILTWDKLSTYNPNELHLIINLSGSNIGDKRWNLKVKKDLIESRTNSNQQLIKWLINNDAKPRLFCANAVGIYGAHATDKLTFTEESQIPDNSESNDFLQNIAINWQNSLHPAIENGLKVTTLRFGVVLKRGEGMLKKLQLPFSLGLGSIFGNGKQVLSWVYYKDLINAIDFLIKNEEIVGPVNITSPNPISQQEFAQIFSNILSRPLFFKTPKFIVNLLFGEMGRELLLKGQRVLPKRLEELGFKFSYPNIESALKEEFKN